MPKKTIVNDEEVKPEEKVFKTRGKDKKPRNISEEGRIKQLEVLKLAREKAMAKRKELQTLNQKAKMLKNIENDKKRVEAEEYDKMIKNSVKKEEPKEETPSKEVVKPKKIIKKIIEEVEDDDDEEEVEEIIVKKKRVNKPKPKVLEEENEPELIQKSANEILKQRILLQRENSYLNTLRMSNY